MYQSAEKSVRIDPLLFCTISLLSMIGLIFIWSATYTTYQPFSFFFKKQLAGVIGATTCLIIAALIDFRTVMKAAYLIYPIYLIMLFYTLLRGTIGLGGQRWINLGLFKFQPSELAKILVPLSASYHLGQQERRKTVSFLFILLIIVLSFILVKKQPDLGTALIIASVGLLWCWFAGLSYKIYATIITAMIISSPLIYTSLKPYQKQRILVFFGYGNNLKEKYQKDQAIIAIGSGGLWGKGILGGTQNKLQFLPEGRTDFVFAVLCEEWGFVGAMLLLLLYCILFLRLFFLVSTIKQPLMQLYAMGVVLHIIIATIINISMVLGMLPIVGIPLPFCSYGLSNLLVNYISIGLFNNVVFHTLHELH